MELPNKTLLIISQVKHFSPTGSHLLSEELNSKVPYYETEYPSSESIEEHQSPHYFRYALMISAN